jgi:hypothetical protein
LASGKSTTVTLIAIGGPSTQNKVDRLINEQLTPARVSQAVDQWHETQPSDIPPPEIINHPIDPAVQTGESQLLGGAMEIKAPWRNQDEGEKAD